ncbi:MAG: GNAT family N-acetyltransferase [Pseudomonadota bacterium]
MNILRAVNEDIPQLGKLLGILFTQEVEFTPDESAQSNGLREIIENPSIGDIFVAKENNEIIGTVNLLYSVSTALGGKVAILEDMIVKPVSRGKGVGSALLNHAISHANLTGCKRISLLTDSSNQSAQNLYRKHGFRKSTMVLFRHQLSTT